jgi:hypothetical protein
MQKTRTPFAICLYSFFFISISLLNGVQYYIQRDVVLLFTFCSGGKINFVIWF